MLKYGLVIFIPALHVTFAQAQQLEPGGPPEQLPENRQIWLSKCPDETRPISGSCALLGTSTTSETLRAFGIIDNRNAWMCNWNVPVSSPDVRALCAKK